MSTDQLIQTIEELKEEVISGFERLAPVVLISSNRARLEFLKHSRKLTEDQVREINSLVMEYATLLKDLQFLLSRINTESGVEILATGLATIVKELFALTEPHDDEPVKNMRKIMFKGSKPHEKYGYPTE